MITVVYLEDGSMEKVRVDMAEKLIEDGEARLATDEEIIEYKNWLYSHDI